MERTEVLVPVSSQGNIHPIWRSRRQNLSSLGSEQRLRLLFASTVLRSITTTTITTRNNLFLLPPPSPWFIINILLTRPPNRMSRLGGTLVLLRKKRIRPYNIRIIDVCFDIGSAPLFFVIDRTWFVFQAHDSADHPVFGKPLKDSLRFASVQISTANASGDLYVWGYIPVVVAKWYVPLPTHTLSLFTFLFVVITIVVFISRKTVRSIYL